MDTYQKICQLCADENLRLSALADKIGVRSSVFSELKMGRTKQLSVATLNKICDYFGVPLSYLTQNDGDGDQPGELLTKRKLLYDLSAKASEEDLDKILLIVEALLTDQK